MAKWKSGEPRDYTQCFALIFLFTLWNLQFLDCDSCDTPDGRTLETIVRCRLDEEKAFMIEALLLVARAKYGADKFGIDDVMRQIPDHGYARPSYSALAILAAVLRHSRSSNILRYYPLRFTHLVSALSVLYARRG